MKNLVYFLITIVFFSCKNEKETDSWIGGQIINPKNDYVILYDGEEIIDSIQLDSNNYFLYPANSLKEGLYSFSHYEFQVFYFEKGDSLMFRVNTLDFDESLSYSGKGAQKNNFLMDMFLTNEKELDIMPKLYQKNQVDFERSLDSLKKMRTPFYQDFLKKDTYSQGVHEIAKASIAYNFFMKKEVYASLNDRKKGSALYKELTPNYFLFRDSIQYNSENLGKYFPYYRYLNKYFDNVIKENSIANTYYSKNSYTHNFEKLKLIDSLVINESLKNNLSKSLLYNYLVNCSKKDKQEELVTLFTSINTNTKHHKIIKEFSSTCKKLSKGNKIPNLMVVSTENTLKDLHSIINQPTILYFWSSNSIKHFKEVHNKAERLKKEFPNYSFLAINMDTHYTNWISILNTYKYNKVEEYQFKNRVEAEKSLLIHSINKAIIVDENAEIINGNTNLFNINIERLLLRAFR